ncbi:unnamed protein product, partial [Dibothriocephalus latus]
MTQERHDLAAKLALAEKDHQLANQQTQAYDEAFRGAQDALLAELRTELAKSQTALQAQTKETRSLRQQVDKLQLQLSDAER